MRGACRRSGRIDAFRRRLHFTNRDRAQARKDGEPGVAGELPNPELVNRPMQASLTPSESRGAVRSRSAVALCALLAVFMACGCGGADEDVDAPVRLVTESERAPIPASAACEDGETRECRITLNVRDGTITCTTGIEECSGGAWGECFRTTDPEEDPAE
jgi:hypothetical protein